MNRSNIIAPKTFADHFSFDRPTNSFSGEISDFRDSVRPWGRLYNDACDEGITLVSRFTGVEVTFVLVEIKKDREGDLLSWEFKSIDGTKPFTLSIIND